MKRAFHFGKKIWAVKIFRNEIQNSSPESTFGNEKFTFCRQKFQNKARIPPPKMNPEVSRWTFGNDIL